MTSPDACEQTWRQLADAQPVQMWAASPDGSLVAANQWVLDYLGVAEAELLAGGGQHQQHLIHPADLPECQRRWSHALETGETYQTDARLLRAADGQYRWHQVRAAPLRDGSGSITHWYGVSTDVDAYKRADEARLAQMEHQRAAHAVSDAERARLLCLFHQAPALIAVTRGPDHVLELANQMFLDSIDHRPVLGKPLREAVPEMGGQGYLELLDHALVTGEPILGNQRLVRLDRHNSGSLVESYYSFIFQPYRSVSGAVDGMLLHAVDVTEQVRTRAALTESETRLRLALQAAQMGIWDWNVLANTITWSDQVEALHGMRPGSFDGRFETWLARVHPDDRDRVTSTIQQAMDLRTTYEMELRVVWDDGSTHWLTTQGHAIYDDSGRAIRMLGGTFDVTERKQAEAFLREEVRTRDDFLAAASHDLKNPLAAVKGTAQLLKRLIQRPEPAPPARLTTGLDSINQAVTQMAGQVDQLLDVARLRMGQPLTLERRSTDLVALVQRQAALSQAASERHQISVHATEPSLTGQWDTNRLERVVGNLLSNAIKYSPSGGGVDVTVSQDGDHAVLAVRDHGIGIPAPDLERIFERFQRAGNVPGRIEGAGIGLAAARQIVEQHGGSISAASQEGAGSTFTIRLPLTPLETVTPPNAVSSPQSVTHPETGAS